MTRFPQQLFSSANECNGIFEAPAIIVNNTMKWSINWSLELGYVLVCSKPQSKTVMDWEATLERLLTTPLLSHFHPIFHTIQPCVQILQCC